ncbi:MULTISPECIES: acetyl-CoA decarbonylase/synthase complex subunit gamma [unclassified Dehalobacter]|uniref:acetyl-CoA decarbonylase/synthase complex subunit gamma n=1 Tax=unclassified Dehalobacter TaxID=2635733 RepID=UPI000E6BCA98|nr:MULTISPECIES: acetyl-CoA decarbonylase/synthase complex subunit gamma [unclassified Dehalobacter]RJE47834.1 acetyl-CoA synthase subunit gamma [Dehalobacter sp. MCB1]TCX49014.1 acetyl-CoA synthase subunit gamma [Dehalobacter sp. 14DCB1]TCX56664.1 acetyl-CoA synthase subunit gamma [Dehalobacter sp. 12DCB1]
MAMSGLDIYKLTPKTNCKECGFPTCMAFAMKVAAGGAEISKCTHMSDDAMAKLSESTAPLMKVVTFGKGEAECKLGGETVLFRHEKTFVNRNKFAVLFSDAMSQEQIDAKIANIKNVDYVRIGEEMRVEIAALQYTGNKDAYLSLVSKVKASGLKVAYMLICADVSVLKDALELVKDELPIVFGADSKNYQEMVDLVKDLKLPLGLKAPSLTELYDLIEAVQKLDYKELLLDAGSSSARETFTNVVQIRRTALKEQDRTFGYPSVVFVNELAKGNKFLEVALASLFTMKYGSIIVMDDMDYARALPLFGLRQNIFTDPQKPMRVEPKFYPINNPGDNSPVLITVDFALTYFVVSGEVERSKVQVWMGIPDAGGYSVLTAWAAGKFSGSVIAKFIKESDIESKTKCRKLIIPGKVAVLKSDIQDSLPDWEVIIGPDEAMHLPKFLRTMEGIN